MRKILEFLLGLTFFLICMTLVASLIGNAWQLLPDTLISDLTAKAFSVECTILLLLIFIDTSLGRPK